MTALAFSHRANVRRLPTGSVRRQYKSADGRYIVIEVCGDAGRYWIAGRQLTGGQLFISRHKSRAAAEAACELHRST